MHRWTKFSNGRASLAVDKVLVITAIKIDHKQAFGDKGKIGPGILPREPMAEHFWLR